MDIVSPPLPLTSLYHPVTRSKPLAHTQQGLSHSLPNTNVSRENEVYVGWTEYNLPMTCDHAHSLAACLRIYSMTAIDHNYRR